MKKKRIFRFGFGFGGWGPKEGGTLLAPGYEKYIEAIVSRFGV